MGDQPPHNRKKVPGTVDPIKVELRTATAAEKPCELYIYHAPPVVQTQGHHPKPVYLQNRLYGQIVDGTLRWFCGNCHSAVHEMIGWLLGESRRPDPMPGYKIRAEAQRTVDWYLEELKKMEAA